MTAELLLKYLNSLVELEKICPVYGDQIAKVLKAIDEELDINND